MKTHTTDELVYLICDRILGETIQVMNARNYVKVLKKFRIRKIT